MKTLFTFLCLIVSSNVLAHEDHALGESLHYAYHLAFATLCVLVAYKGTKWLKAKKQNKK